MTEAPDMDRLRTMFLAGRCHHTTQTYNYELIHFQRWLGAASWASAGHMLFGVSESSADELIKDYLNHLIESKIAPNSINRRMAVLRSLYKFAKQHRIYRGELYFHTGIKKGNVRETRGPTRSQVMQMMAHSEARQDNSGIRDHAILRCLYDLALRCNEVCNLDLEHFSAENATLSIHGKGRSTRETLRIPSSTREAISAWLKVRGNWAGPLFVSKPKQDNRQRLGTKTLYSVIRKIGQAIGIKVWPHAMRHSAITTALDVTNGDVRRVRQFSRHKNISTLMIYDDQRSDEALNVAREVSKTMTSPGKFQGKNKMERILAEVQKFKETTGLALIGLGNGIPGSPLGNSSNALNAALLVIEAQIKQIQDGIQ